MKLSKFKWDKKKADEGKQLEVLFATNHDYNLASILKMMYECF